MQLIIASNANDLKAVNVLDVSLVDKFTVCRLALQEPRLKTH